MPAFLSFFLYGLILLWNLITFQTVTYIALADVLLSIATLVMISFSVLSYIWPKWWNYLIFLSAEAFAIIVVFIMLVSHDSAPTYGWGALAGGTQFIQYLYLLGIFALALFFTLMILLLAPRRPKKALPRPDVPPAA